MSIICTKVSFIYDYCHTDLWRRANGNKITPRLHAFVDILLTLTGIFEVHRKTVKSFKKLTFGLFFNAIDSPPWPLAHGRDAEEEEEEGGVELFLTPAAANLPSETSDTPPSNSFLDVSTACKT